MGLLSLRFTLDADVKRAFQIGLYEARDLFSGVFSVSSQVACGVYYNVYVVSGQKFCRVDDRIVHYVPSFQAIGRVGCQNLAQTV